MLSSIIKNVEYLGGGRRGMKCMNLRMIMFLSSALKMHCALKNPNPRKNKSISVPPTQGREGKVCTYSSKIMAYTRATTKKDLPSL